MLPVLPLLLFDPAAVSALISGGYETREKYSVEWSESEAETLFRLRLVTLPQPYRKTFEVLPEDLERYRGVVELGYSFYIPASADSASPLSSQPPGTGWAGVAIAEPQAWNRTLWVWEFNIVAAFQGQGLGRRLMDALAEKAAACGLRALVCETQTTNVPAIRFYRAVGFHAAAIDTSYYTNQDYPDGEMAIFMKRKVG